MHRYFSIEPSMPVSQFSVVLGDLGFSRDQSIGKCVLYGRRGESVWVYGDDAVELIAVSEYQPLPSGLIKHLNEHNFDVFREDQAGYWNGTADEWLAHYLNHSRGEILGWAFKRLHEVAAGNDLTRPDFDPDFFAINPFAPRDAAEIAQHVHLHEPAYADPKNAEPFILSIFAEYRSNYLMCPF